MMMSPIKFSSPEGKRPEDFDQNILSMQQLYIHVHNQQELKLQKPERENVDSCLNKKKFRKMTHYKDHASRYQHEIMQHYIPKKFTSS